MLQAVGKWNRVVCKSAVPVLVLESKQLVIGICLWQTYILGSDAPMKRRPFVVQHGDGAKGIDRLQLQILLHASLTTRSSLHSQRLLTPGATPIDAEQPAAAAGRA